jgi:hypothetical protein
MLQIDSAMGPVKPLPTSYTDGERRLCAGAKESHSLRQDATVLVGELVSACSVSCEYGPRDSRPRIHFQAFSDVAHSEVLRSPASRGDSFQPSARRFRSATGSGRSCEWV